MRSPRVPFSHQSLDLPSLNVFVCQACRGRRNEHPVVCECGDWWRKRGMWDSVLGSDIVRPEANIEMPSWGQHPQHELDGAKRLVWTRLTGSPPAARLHPPRRWLLSALSALPFERPHPMAFVVHAQPFAQISVTGKRSLVGSSERVGRACRKTTTTFRSRSHPYKQSPTTVSTASPASA
jgi:hypothetical protein